MQSARQKISNLASVAKEHKTICKAKLEEEAEMVSTRTPEEKELAGERRKAKEAQAKMELHHAKAKHAAQKTGAAKHPVLGSGSTGIGTANYATMAAGPGTTAPALGGRHGHHPDPGAKYV